jgi:hypothetical protein
MNHFPSRIRTSWQQYIAGNEGDGAEAIASAWNRQNPSYQTDAAAVQRRIDQLRGQKRKDPTPEQIRKRAARIRKYGFVAVNGKNRVSRKPWSAYQRWTRMAEHPVPWTLPGADNIQREADAVAEMLGEEKREATE